MSKLHLTNVRKLFLIAKIKMYFLHLFFRNAIATCDLTKKKGFLLVKPTFLSDPHQDLGVAEIRQIMSSARLQYVMPNLLM